VFDSRTIVEYLDTLTPVSHLIPGNGSERVEVRTWEALADGLLDAAILWFGWSTTLRMPTQQSSAWVERQMAKVRAALHWPSQRAGRKALVQTVRRTRWPISRSAARLDGWTSASRRSTGARGIRNLARHYEKLSARQSFIETAPPTA